MAEVGPIRSSPDPSIYVRTGSATYCAQPVAKGTSRLAKATALRAKSFREKAWHSWHTSSFLSPAGEEVIKQFARLLKLSCVCLVANFEDGIRRQLSAFRCRLRSCMEEIQERVTHRPDFGQYQFDGIGRPLSRSAQSGLTQPLGEGLSRSFGGSFYFCQFLGSQSRGRGLGAEAGLRLFSERQTGLWISLNAGTTHWTNRLVALLRLIPLRLNCVIVSSQEALALQRVYASRHSGATFRKQTSSFDIAVTQRRRILLTQRKLTCVNAEVSSGAPQFPNWG